MNLPHLKAKLQVFINHYNKIGIAPSEREIDDFLTPSTKHYRNTFIKFCFYYWEKRNENRIVNIAIKDMKLNKII